MTVKTLQSFCPTLSREERTGLASATARGGETELERIHGYAPCENWILPHHDRSLNALTACAMVHGVEQLELVGRWVCGGTC